MNFTLLLASLLATHAYSSGNRNRLGSSTPKGMVPEAANGAALFELPEDPKLACYARMLPSSDTPIPDESDFSIATIVKDVEDDQVDLQYIARCLAYCDHNLDYVQKLKNSGRNVSSALELAIKATLYLSEHLSGSSAIARDELYSQTLENLKNVAILKTISDEKKLGIIMARLQEQFKSFSGALGAKLTDALNFLKELEADLKASKSVKSSIHRLDESKFKQASSSHLKDQRNELNIEGLSEISCLDESVTSIDNFFSFGDNQGSSEHAKNGNLDDFELFDENDDLNNGGGEEPPQVAGNEDAGNEEMLNCPFATDNCPIKSDNSSQSSGEEENGNALGHKEPSLGEKEPSLTGKAKETLSKLKDILCSGWLSCSILLAVGAAIGYLLLR